MRASSGPVTAVAQEGSKASASGMDHSDQLIDERRRVGVDGRKLVPLGAKEGEQHPIDRQAQLVELGIEIRGPVHAAIVRSPPNEPERPP